MVELWLIHIIETGTYLYGIHGMIIRYMGF